MKALKSIKTKAAALCIGLYVESNVVLCVVFDVYRRNCMHSPFFISFLGMTFNMLHKMYEEAAIALPLSNISPYASGRFSVLEVARM